jgi:hypothetical protein
MSSINTHTRVVLLLHRDEASKSQNTGQPAVRSLARGTVIVSGDLSAMPPLADDETPLVLFPEPQARPVSDFNGTERIVLIVPDGNWAQATSMRRSLSSVPSVSLWCPHPSPNGYGYETAVALGKALRILEGEQGPAVEAAVLHQAAASLAQRQRQRTSQGVL